MNKLIHMYRHLPKNIFIMFFVRFVNSVGGFVVSFLSLYLTTKLGYSTALAASIVTLTVLIRIPGSLFGGILADRWNKKNAYICTQSLAALCVGFCAFLSNGALIIFFLVLSTFFGAAVRPILNAFVYDLVDDSQRKNAYSFVYLGINFGAAVGPLFSGFLFHHYLVLFFLADALSSFMAVCLVAFFVFVPIAEPLKDKNIVQQFQKDTSILAFLKFLSSNPLLVIFFLFNISLSFMYAQGSFSLPLLLKDIYHGKSAVLYGTLMSVNAVTCIIATTFITYLTRHRSLLFNIACSSICLGVGFGLLLFPFSYGIFILSTVLWTFGEILMSTNIGIYVVEQVDCNMRTRSSAFQSITSAIGNSLGVFLMGFVITSFHISFVWPIIFLLGVCTFFAIRALEFKSSTIHEQSSPIL